VSLYDVGDVAVLTTTITDPATGAPVTPTGVACTLTAPDLTVSTPTVNVVTTGVYSTQIVLTQAGLWAGVWTSTGTGQASESFLISVRQQSTAFITLDEVKRQLNKTTTTDDDELRDMIDAATEVIEAEVGPIAARTVVEAYHGGYSEVVLRKYPIIKVSDIREIWTNTIVQLTEQPVGTLTDNWGYTVDLAHGTVLRRSVNSSITIFPKGWLNVLVTYVIGRTAIPAALNMAARQLVAHLWQTQSSRAVGRPIPGGDEFTPMPGSGFLVPNRVSELLMPHVLPPSIA
jgi:hypothetical protein